MSSSRDEVFTDEEKVKFLRGFFVKKIMFGEGIQYKRYKRLAKKRYSENFMSWKNEIIKTFYSFSINHLKHFLFCLKEDKIKNKESNHNLNIITAFFNLIILIVIGLGSCSAVSSTRSIFIIGGIGSVVSIYEIALLIDEILNIKYKERIYLYYVNIIEIVDGIIREKEKQEQLEIIRANIRKKYAYRK